MLQPEQTKEKDVFCMGWIRGWIMQIAGIIVLGALCDMIMPEGDMKKYAKLVVGLVFAFAVVRPIVNISTENLVEAIPKNARVEAVELRDSLDDLEKKQIISLYCGKLEDKIREEIRGECPGEIWIDVKVEEKDKENFGNIRKIEILCKKTDKGVDAEKIRNAVRNKFRVDEETVEVTVN